MSYKLVPVIQYDYCSTKVCKELCSNSDGDSVEFVDVSGKMAIFAIVNPTDP